MPPSSRHDIKTLKSSKAYSSKTPPSALGTLSYGYNGLGISYPIFRVMLRVPLNVPVLKTVSSYPTCNNATCNKVRSKYKTIQ